MTQAYCRERCAEFAVSELGFCAKHLKAYEERHALFDQIVDEVEATHADRLRGHDTREVAEFMVATAATPDFTPDPDDLPPFTGPRAEPWHEGELEYARHNNARLLTALGAALNPPVKAPRTVRRALTLVGGGDGPTGS